MDKLQAMAIFVKVVEAGSLSAAARSLGLSLTAVSRQLAALEDALETVLVVRTTRHRRVTEPGRVYYERTKRILGEIGEAELALSAQKAVPSGRLLVSAPTLLGSLRLAPLLPAFLAQYQGIGIDLILTDRGVNLAEDAIDVALRIGPLEDSSLIARKLDNIQMVVCASPAYLEQRGEPFLPQDLSGHDCLTFSANPGDIEWRFETLGGTQAVELRGRLCTNNLDAAVKAAAEGAGIVRAPSWQVADYVTSGRLRIVLAQYQRPATPLHALFLPGRLPSPRIRAFIDYLAAHWEYSWPSC